LKQLGLGMAIVQQVPFTSVHFCMAAQDSSALDLSRLLADAHLPNAT